MMLTHIYECMQAQYRIIAQLNIYEWYENAYSLWNCWIQLKIANMTSVRGWKSSAMHFFVCQCMCVAVWVTLVMLLLNISYSTKWIKKKKSHQAVREVQKCKKKSFSNLLIKRHYMSNKKLNLNCSVCFLPKPHRLLIISTATYQRSALHFVRWNKTVHQHDGVVICDPFSLV